MGGFNFSIPFLIGLVAGIITLTGIISHVRARKKGTRPPEGCYKPGCLGCSGVITLFCSLIVLGYILSDIGTSSTSPSCFSQTFHIPVPADVRDLNSFSRGFVDSEEMYLKFKCNSATFSLLTNEFTSVTRRDIEYSMITDRQPEWWTPFSDEPELYCLAERFNNYYGSSRAYMCYDTNTATCYFYWFGAD